MTCASFECLKKDAGETMQQKYFI